MCEKISYTFEIETYKKKIKMNNIGLYWEFHRSTLLLNLVVSVCSILLTKSFMYIPITMMTAGPFLSLFHKEITAKNEYYFYYNRGITKVKLIVISQLANIITGSIIFVILLKCQAS